MTETGTILVTGVTGKVGRRVATELLDIGADVRGLARNPASAHQTSTVPTVPGDLSEPGTLGAAMQGITSVFLLWPMFSTQTAASTVATIAEHARRVVYLSAAGDQEGGRPDGFWGEIEDLIDQSGLEWTFLRPTGFASNTLQWADQIRNDGIVRWPYGAAGRSLIHEADIAAVAVRALTEDGHSAAAYHLTGPEVVTQADQVRLIGKAIGRDVRWEELSPDDARRHLLAEWGDAGFVDTAMHAWAAMVDHPEPVTTTVEKITGVSARTFEEWAIDHADHFR